MNDELTIALEELLEALKGFRASLEELNENISATTNAIEDYTDI
jgi:hypothetical protein